MERTTGQPDDATSYVIVSNNTASDEVANFGCDVVSSVSSVSGSTRRLAENLKEGRLEAQI